MHLFPLPLSSGSLSHFRSYVLKLLLIAVLDRANVIVSVSLFSTLCLHFSTQLTSISFNHDKIIFRPQLSTPPGSKQCLVRLHLLSDPLSPNIVKKQYTNRKSLAGHKRCNLSLSLMSSPLLLLLPSILSLSSLQMGERMCDFFA